MAGKVLVALNFSFFCRESISSQETGALISDKDRELETLRNEVLWLDFMYFHRIIWAVCWIHLVASWLQIAVLRGENAMAKTLQSAVETLERDKAQLQSRVHSLEKRLVGTQASEGEDAGAPPSGEETTISASAVLERGFFANLFFWFVGDAALEQLKEEKEFAEGQVRLWNRFTKSIFSVQLRVLSSYLCPDCLHQINFLNSVIVDLQRKNEELKIKLKKLALAEFNGNEETDG